MATLDLNVTGDQITSYSSAAISGKSNGTKVTLGGTSPLGSSTDVFKIVITNVAPGDTGFSAGQTISVYSYPLGTLVSSSLTVNPNDYNGRATSADHFILDGPGSTGIIIDLNGVSSGSMQIGPGVNPTRYEYLPFSSLDSTPPAFPCFVTGTLIETKIGPLPIETLRPGDRVSTVDHGLQRIVWIGKCEVPAMGKLAPNTGCWCKIGGRICISDRGRLWSRQSIW